MCMVCGPRGYRCGLQRFELMTRVSDQNSNKRNRKKKKESFLRKFFISLVKKSERTLFFKLIFIYLSDLLVCTFYLLSTDQTSPSLLPLPSILIIYK